MKQFILCPGHIIGKKDPPRRWLGLTAAGIHHLITGVLLTQNLRITTFNGILNVGDLVGLRGPLLEIVVIVSTCLKIVLDTEWLDGESNDTRLISFGFHTVILNFNIHMIVNIRLLGITSNKPNRETLPIPSRHSGIILHFGCSGNIIHNPIIMIIFTNGTDHLVRTHALLFPPSQVGNAKLFAKHVHLHVKTVGGGFDAVSG
mmetsp:Transcript_5708/g.12960  ORF Transcript_5708/g.12960 Transcript_5708/m.12960 type:complete len:203 (+) Transcript_5708:1299-1907(+)